ncbi:formate-dependent uric acid utilization protein AegA [Celerinatantimonas diazotrophica]|uniref:Glutamate synthase small subunit-like protein n=1 Tax=Celerinatantimonas diazotrophica TaxID=412034 RepID=A0A4R1K2Z0_9GAMM|nr:formate-dependent uric acid utilization protein AegA [Celerinatantimonas diazotrophica]TCK58063.1 glutamate synthase small subunit-like protein [Celerinatantimonas diazotrophica]CAG9297868.1 Ferredoxin--NADP reductase [Celerinatantimonas diazotrophica]
MNRFILTNSQQCIGCYACEVACVMAHNDNQHALTDALFQPRIHVFRSNDKNSAATCRHCEQAPCMASCPNGAITQVNGSIQIDQRLCIGCKTCEVNCPFGAIEVVVTALGDGKVSAQAIKCDLCIERENGPACVENCPTDALSVVSDESLAEIVSQRRHLSAIRSAEPWYRTAPAYSDVSPLKAARKGNTQARREPKKIDDQLRKTTFTELYQTFDKAQADEQSERCLKCGENSICQWRCPLHNHIPQWIELLKQGRVVEAAELSHQTNCMPEITGRICPQDRLCESNCTLKDESGAVTVGNIERYITETAFANGWRPQITPVHDTGYRVAIVGAGPAGLACADVLVRQGVQVRVFDRNPEIGGLLTFGIPAFKLDKSLLVRRREIFMQMGIEFQLNCEIGKDLQFKELIDQYDAVFVGVGTYQPMAVGLEHDDAPGVYEALDFLMANTRKVMGLSESPSQPYIDLANQQVVVLGGGDTAMDCVRTALRQDAANVICAYRRDETNMPGSHKEVKNAKEEGAHFEFNVQPVSLELNENGHICGIKMLRTQLGEPDEDGRRRPQPIVGSEFVMRADAVVIAFGFLPHSVPWLERANVQLDNKGRIMANVQSNYPYQTSNPKIFAGGDAVRGADLVVTAMAEGRHAAQGIIEYLG